MRYLFIDTEAKAFKADTRTSFESLQKWPPIAQIAWQVYESDGTLIKEENTYLAESDDEKTALSKETLKTLIRDINEYNPILVGHNISFDKNIVGAELIRQEIRNVLAESRSICTMEQTVEYCELENPNNEGSFKYPKLQELHVKLFKEEFDGAHDALNDVKATSKCFFQLKNQGFEFEIQQDELSNYPDYESYLKDKLKNLLDEMYHGIVVTEFKRLLEIVPDSITDRSTELKFLRDNFLAYNKGMEFELFGLSISAKRKFFLDYLIDDYYNKFSLNKNAEEYYETSKGLGVELPEHHFLYFHLSILTHTLTRDFKKLELIKKYDTYVDVYDMFLSYNESITDSDSFISPSSTNIYGMYKYWKEKNEGNLDYDVIMKVIFPLFSYDLFTEKSLKVLSNDWLISMYKDLNKVLYEIKPNLTQVQELVYYKLICDLQERVPDNHKTYLQSVKESYSRFNEEDKGGCYIATLCYDGYDQKEVLVFRNFRDQVLKKSVLGRLFITTYYAISPKLVSALKPFPEIQIFIKKYILNPLYHSIKSR